MTEPCKNAGISKSGKVENMEEKPRKQEEKATAGISHHSSQSHWEQWAAALSLGQIFYSRVTCDRRAPADMQQQREGQSWSCHHPPAPSPPPHLPSKHHCPKARMSDPLTNQLSTHPTCQPSVLRQTDFKAGFPSGGWSRRQGAEKQQPSGKEFTGAGEVKLYTAAAESLLSAQTQP